MQTTLNKQIIELLDPECFNVLNRFIESKKKTSTGSAKAFKSAINRFIEFVNNSNFQDISIEKAEEYFRFLDNKKTGKDNNKPMKLTYKKTQLRLVYSFFDWYKYQIRQDNPNYINPIPLCKYFTFSPEKSLSLNETDKNLENRMYTPEKIIKILHELAYTAPRKYIRMNNVYLMIGTLLTFTGMRISECVSIKVNDIVNNLRYLRTGMINGARKSNKENNKPLIFCFPKIVSYMLSEYIIDLREKYPEMIDSETDKFKEDSYLFPSYKLQGHISQKTVSNVFNNLNLSFPVLSHTFRRTIETYQLNSNNKIPLYIVELLSNHSISSTVMKHYNTIKNEERLRIYDESLPKEYISILRYLDSL